VVDVEALEAVEAVELWTLSSSQLLRLGLRPYAFEYRYVTQSGTLMFGGGTRTNEDGGHGDEVVKERM
jgi:hypothetical protein